MIILDTNVLSAMRTVPDLTVVMWLDRQPADTVWITHHADRCQHR